MHTIGGGGQAASSVQKKHTKGHRQCCRYLLTSNSPKQPQDTWLPTPGEGPVCTLQVRTTAICQRKSANTPQPPRRSPAPTLGPGKWGSLRKHSQVCQQGHDHQTKVGFSILISPKPGFSHQQSQPPSLLLSSNFCDQRFLPSDSEGPEWVRVGERMGGNQKSAWLSLRVIHEGPAQLGKSEGPGT